MFETACPTLVANCINQNLNNVFNIERLHKDISNDNKINMSLRFTRSSIAKITHSTETIEDFQRQQSLPQLLRNSVARIRYYRIRGIWDAILHSRITVEL